MQANPVAGLPQSPMAPADRNASASVNRTVCGDTIPGVEPLGRPVGDASRITLAPIAN